MSEKIDCPLCGMLMRRIAMSPDAHGKMVLICICPSCKTVVHLTND